VLVVRYEDLQTDTEYWLRRIAAHMRLGLSDAAFAEALRFARRDAIRIRLDPSDTEIAVPPDGASSAVVFSHGDKAFVRNAMARCMRHDFGYGYTRALPPTA
jgi:hypothetical protein